MTLTHAASNGDRDAAAMLAAIVDRDGSARHPHVAATAKVDCAEATRNAADAVHHLCMLHGRHPGVVDHAALRGPSEARTALSEAADSFAVERALLAQLVVAVGPIPGTPGQAETEASVIASRHAIDMLAQSDRTGCAAGAALALMLDWHPIRGLLDRTALRFGVDAQPLHLPSRAHLVELAGTLSSTGGVERAMLFGAQQIATQHRGLWDLLEARARARAA